MGKTNRIEHFRRPWTQRPVCRLSQLVGGVRIVGRATVVDAPAPGDEEDPIVYELTTTAGRKTPSRLFYLARVAPYKICHRIYIEEVAE